MGRLKLRVSKNRVLRRIFGPKMKDAMEGWRKLYNEKLLNVYSSPNVMLVTVIMKSGGRNGRDKWQARQRREMHRECW